MNSHSYFWRHPDQLTDLQNQLATLPPGPAPIRVWSAGCAHGQEAFSVAALLAGLGKDFEMVATDICPANLEIAKLGSFQLRRGEVIPSQIRRFFQENEDGFTLRKEVLEKVSFQVDDLRATRVRGTFNLIICRNVLIYFSPLESRAALMLFQDMLGDDGLLVLGYAEATLSDVSNFLSTGRHATYTHQKVTSAPIKPPTLRQKEVPRSPLTQATKAFSDGRLEEARQLFQETLKLKPVPQISYYFLTLLAVDLNDMADLQERIRHLKHDLDFSDTVSREILSHHGISPERFQKTLLRLLGKYERSL